MPSDVVTFTWTQVLRSDNKLRSHTGLRLEFRCSLSYVQSHKQTHVGGQLTHQTKAIQRHLDSETRLQERFDIQLKIATKQLWTLH